MPPRPRAVGGAGAVRGRKMPSKEEVVAHGRKMSSAYSATGHILGWLFSNTPLFYFSCRTRLRKMFRSYRWLPKLIFF
jgi:hypothetical protein